MVMAVAHPAAPHCYPHHSLTTLSSVRLYLDSNWINIKSEIHIKIKKRKTALYETFLILRKKAYLTKQVRKVQTLLILHLDEYIWMWTKYGQ